MILEISEGLLLKPIGSADADSLFRLTDASRETLREWLPWVDATVSVEQTRGFIQACEQQIAANDGFQTGIWFDGELAGCIGFHRIDRANRKTSIGYWLGNGFQGRGLMTQACRKMVDYAFDFYDLNRVEIRCGVENLKSRAIPERLGFVQEGRLRQTEKIGDRFIDHYVYGMLRSEWLNRGSAQN